MSIFFEYLCDTIFPPTEDSVLVRRCIREKNIEDFYTPGIIGNINYIGHMHAPTVRACVHEAKFFNNKKAIEILSCLLTLYITRNFPETEILIPIPLSKKRIRERGHNQVVSIIQETLKKIPGPKMETSILKRARHTIPQTELNRDQRLTNLKGVFVVNNKTATNILKEKHVILLDDVTTTGSTLKEAFKALEPLHPKSLTLVAIAH